MDHQDQLLNEKYARLYEGYYDKNEWLVKKRKLSAIDSARNIIDATNKSTNLSLLDVGAGDGNVLAELSGTGVFVRMVALEISDSGIEKIKLRNISELNEVKKFDGYQISFKNKEFDLGIAIHVLEHVEHERLFLSELGRVSKKALIEVPLEHGFNICRAISNGKKTGHINFYTIETLASLLETSGYKIIESKVTAPSVEYEKLLYGASRGRVKNILRKILLKFFPTTAPKFFTYNGYVYCDCPD
ncbi:class I SAM-dependent methyltransferase [Polynucleobacter sp. MWH-UH19D]|uniref:class I SAM-dependent methyltransferase n=1 Tax=Polynucleobacter sp. MWH-UH19D TaxID=1855610 RepID=UPI003364E189